MSKAKVPAATLTVQQVKKMLGSGEIFAFFDVREEGEFSIKGHPLFATPLPLSRLEPRAFALLPDPGTRIVLMDSGEPDTDPQWAGRANRAAARLSQMGYTDLLVMKGGLKAWADAGYEVFTGVNVPSKAFGEVVEHDNDTPRIDAADVQKLIDARTDMVILDSRPLPEFTNMSIPGGVDCPGAELVYRVKDFAPRPETLVIVNCAGRTRSIIGAQSLINAGLPNKVMALKNGTMGWHLAGLKVARGETKSFGPQGPEAAKFAQDAATHIAERMNIRKIDMAGFKARITTARKYFSDFGLGAYCGFGRAPASELPCILDDHLKAVEIAEGRAEVVEGSNNAKLKVSFFGPFYGDYWVLDHAPDYSWAIVGEPSGRYLWLLSRTAHPSKATLRHIESRAAETSYDLKMLKWTEQP